MTIVRRPMASLGVLLVGASVFGVLASCAPGYDAVQTDPSLYPIFQFGVTDYVNRCDPDEPTTVTVSAPDGTTISIDGQPPRAGKFTTSVEQQVNERFTIVVSGEEGTTTHHVRCLPEDFPEWESLRTGTPQAEFYATVIVDGFEPNVPVIFDTNGVPVWWGNREPTFLFTPLSNDNFAAMYYGGGMVERRLDGTVVRILNTEGAPSDFHDILRLPNGDYLMASIEGRPCDLSPWGEGQGTCLFHEFQRMRPTGQVVWRWQPEDDIPLNETAMKWRSVRDSLGRADPWHYNSIAWTGDGLIVSFRHMDAIYKIDFASQDVDWKLGGSTRPESLQVVGDPVFDGGGSISGQHDARRLPGGFVSLFDNGSMTGRAPRSVTYRINEATRTATLRRQVTDPIAPTSACCGSTRVLPGGHVVTGWGGNPWITENTPDGTQVFRLDANFVYRGIPILPGRFTRDQLRAGMDAQYDDGEIASRAVADVPSGADDPGDVRSRLGLPVGVEIGD
jgi:hypothetical protein